MEKHQAARPRVACYREFSALGVQFPYSRLWLSGHNVHPHPDGGYGWGDVLQILIGPKPKPKRR